MPGRRVALEEDLVAAAGVVLAAEEVVEADLVERGRRGVRRDVAADADPGPLRPVHHDRRVPADPRPVAALHLLVAGEPGLRLGRDGVDVVGRGQAGDADATLAGALEQREHEVARPGAPPLVDGAVEGRQPLLRLLGVDVGELAGQAVEDGPGVLACDHGDRSLRLRVLPARRSGRTGPYPTILLPAPPAVTSTPHPVASAPPGAPAGAPRAVAAAGTVAQGGCSAVD